MIKRFLFAFGMLVSSSVFAAGLCQGKFPNFVTDYCWSCIYPIKMFGSILYDGGQDDFTGRTNTDSVCYCSGSSEVGSLLSFWEPDLMTDVTYVPGCMPLLGGVQIDVGMNKNAYGEQSMARQGVKTAGATSFTHTNLYINPVLYVMEVLLDFPCLDSRGMDVPWMSIFDPTHNDEELAMVMTPYAFPFAGLPAIHAITADTIAASTGFPLEALFWTAYGHLYPLTGYNTHHMSNESSGRIQTARILAKQHAAGTQWSGYGDSGTCGYYPQIIMDKRQYKFQRLAPFPQTQKIAGKCCDPISRSTILAESNTEAPISSMRDFGYAVFRKRECCAGVFGL